MRSTATPEARKTAAGHATAALHHTKASKALGFYSVDAMIMPAAPSFGREHPAYQIWFEIRSRSKGPHPLFYVGVRNHHAEVFTAGGRSIGTYSAPEGGPRHGDMKGLVPYTTRRGVKTYAVANVPRTLVAAEVQRLLLRQIGRLWSTTDKQSHGAVLFSNPAGIAGELSDTLNTVLDAKVAKRVLYDELTRSMGLVGTIRKGDRFDRLAKYLAEGLWKLRKEYD